MNQFRQGDVLFVRVDEIPATAKAAKPTDDRVIVEYGEHTGHHHSICADDAELLTGGTADQAEQYLRVHRQTQITHQEHPAITIEPGQYMRVPQYEYRPAALPQRVLD